MNPTPLAELWVNEQLAHAEAQARQAKPSVPGYLQGSKHHPPATCSTDAPFLAPTPVYAPPAQRRLTRSAPDPGDAA